MADHSEDSYRNILIIAVMFFEAVLVSVKDLVCAHSIADLSSNRCALTRKTLP